MYKFDYADHMKEYRKKNKVENKIEKVELKDGRQLKNKLPKFLIELSSEYGTHEMIVRTTRLADGTFQVRSGSGQFAFGIIERKRDENG